MHRAQEAPLIELRHLTKTYGAVRAIEDVSLDVRAGEVLALLGPNGSGKTTTLKCMTGLVAPTSGMVRVAGAKSYLPQHVSFDEHLSCREVLDFFRRLRKLPPRRVDEVIESWVLTGVAARPVRELSGGTAQRLGIAVAELPDAPVLLLDEPTASLDPAAALLLRSRLREWADTGKAVVFASHALADAEAAADRVAIFLDGRLAAIEPLQSLRLELRSASLEEIYVRYTDETSPACGRLVQRMPARAAQTGRDRSR